jgi:shikimate dehydrogenase
LVNAPDRYAVIGHPIAHSKSPAIHAAFARQTGQNLVYERLPAALDAFVTSVEQFARDGGKGLNVTAPFKVEAFALARQHSERAAQAAACNTLAWRGTHWFGDNTDGAGLVRELTVNLGLELRARDILILGCRRCCKGPARSAARGVAAAGHHQQSKYRSRQRARELCSRRTARCAFASRPDLRGSRFDIVLNATSASSSAQDDLERFQLWPSTIFAVRRGRLRSDVRGSSRRRSCAGRKHTAPRMLPTGLGMLIEQAAESFFLWRGVRPDTAPVFPLLRANWGPRNVSGPIASER